MVSDLQGALMQARQSSWQHGNEMWNESDASVVSASTARCECLQLKRIILFSAEPINLVNQHHMTAEGKGLRHRTKVAHKAIHLQSQCNGYKDMKGQPKGRTSASAQFCNPVNAHQGTADDRRFESLHPYWEEMIGQKADYSPLPNFPFCQWASQCC